MSWCILIHYFKFIKLQMGGQKPGFYEKTSLQPADLVKNPVSLTKRISLDRTQFDRPF
ncbi:hypothetical protein QUA56_09800 [Microcoleus sp. N3A4]|uniref:hypothetical protein n=1 Tax=Microcoleus sp. N3A4 TaxID=3055379 RepID=UPI002FCF8B13